MLKGYCSSCEDINEVYMESDLVFRCEMCHTLVLDLVDVRMKRCDDCDSTTRHIEQPDGYWLCSVCGGST